MNALLNRIRKTAEDLSSLRLSAFFLPAALLLFVLFKSGYLRLPFYWDEAWSYAKAILDMHDHGITLLPGSANAELTRGHPLFFYFLSASWMKLFGTSPAAAHILPLLISCLLIIVLFLFCRSYFNLATAMVAVSFLSLQAIFLAQSGLLLPEVLIALLVLTSVLAYFRQSRGLFLLAASLLVLTKESGMVVALVFLLDAWFIRPHFIAGEPLPFRSAKPSHTGINHQGYARPETTRFYRHLFKTWHLFIPPAVFLLFIILQKVRSGWYFYPEHMGMIDLSRAGMMEKGSAFLKGLFLRNGRFLFLGAAIGCFAMLRIRNCLSAKEKHFLWFSGLLAVAYGIFCAINFFSQRYVMALLPVTLAAGSALITSCLSQKRIMYGTTIIILMGFFILHARFLSRNESDVSLGYKDTVLLHREVVHYAGQQDWNDKLVYSTFLMQYNLSDPRMGYLEAGQTPLHEVRNVEGLKYDLYLFCSNERDSLRERLASDGNFILLKRFERGKAWAEVYVPLRGRVETE